jgi:prevent-host-death family protein
MANWQVQEAKARLSELIEKARTEGPQTITKHGSEAAVVLSMDEYRRLSKRGSEDFVDWLLNGPKWPEGFELPERQIDPPREVDLGDK